MFDWLPQFASSFSEAIAIGLLMIVALIVHGWYLDRRNERRVKNEGMRLKGNDFEHVHQDLNKIIDALNGMSSTLKRIEEKQSTMADNVLWIKSKNNGD